MTAFDPPSTPELFQHGGQQAIEAGRFPAWWADVWLSNGLAKAHPVDRGWLLKFGGRLEAAMTGDRGTWAARLRELMRWLVKEGRSGRCRTAADFFLEHVVSDMHHRTAREFSGLLPESKQARAFGAAVAAIRYAQDQAREAGLTFDLATANLQFIAELVARDVLKGEGVSVTDVLTAIQEHTRAIPLAEWVEQAPTKH